MKPRNTHDQHNNTSGGKTHGGDAPWPRQGWQPRQRKCSNNIGMAHTPRQECHCRPGGDRGGRRWRTGRHNCVPAGADVKTQTDPQFPRPGPEEGTPRCRIESPCPRGCTNNCTASSERTSPGRQRWDCTSAALTRAEGGVKWYGVDPLLMR